ncbi:MAG: GGDEF domain-containing protein [Proteobacteria bacterium]|nr:GGDEF domain-containing protein [Pseudomonadota bacterium]
MNKKKSIDYIIENSSNPYLKEVHGNSNQAFTMEHIEGIFEYEHGTRLATVFKKEFELLKRNDIITELESEHGNSLALIIETESQKFELEELKKNLEILTAKLERLSVIDGLTNIANRRHFDNFIDFSWRCAMRDSQTLSILMIDVDHFKPYNDNYGHQKGDDCLKKVAATLNRFGKRAKDLVARYGGEEFAFILSNTTKFHLLKIAEDIRKAIENMNITHEYSDVSDRVTISVGASICTPSKENSQEILLQAADKGLYQAKKMGRNIVKFHEIST